MMGNFGYGRGMKIWLLPLIILFSAKKVTARDYLAEIKDTFPVISQSSHQITNQDPHEESLPNLACFPHETLLHMISFMKVKDACRFHQTCKAFWKLKDDLHSWKNRIQVPEWFADLNPLRDNLLSLKKRLMQQESLFPLHKALKINVNGIKRGIIHIHSTMDTDQLFRCLKDVPDHFFVENKDFQWLKWIATAPLLTDSKKLPHVAVWLNPDYRNKGKLTKKEIFHYWRDQLKSLVSHHPLAGFTFALLSQILPGNAGVGIDVEFSSLSSTPHAQFKIETYPPSFEEIDLVIGAFQGAVKAEIPTAAFEYAKYIEPSLGDFAQAQDLYKKMMLIAEKEKNWSGEQVYTLFD